MNEKLKRRRIPQVAEEKALFNEKESNDVEGIVGKMMYALEFGRARSILSRPQLAQILADYFFMQSSCAMSLTTRTDNGL